MKQKVDPKLFFGLIVVIAIVAGVMLYKSLQPPAAMVAKPSSNAMYNPGTEQYKQAMTESMNRSQPLSGSASGAQYRQGYNNMMMRSAPPSR